MILFRFIKLSIVLSIIYLLPFSTPLTAVENDISSKSKKIIQYKNDYLLDTGDRLFIQFEDVDIFSAEYAIDINGELFLPEIGFISARGKTLNELTLELKKRYEEYLYNNDLFVFIRNYRPVKVTLRGEVNRTGLYELAYDQVYSSSDITKSRNFQDYKDIFYAEQGNSINQISSTNKAPRLFDLIKMANGVSPNGDLSNVEVVRKNSISEGGGKIKTTINLISLIKEGDQTQNIVLRDGDDIFVKKSSLILLDQILEINKSNLTPDFIEVYLNGNVYKSEPLILRQGTTLNQAIAAAGGLRNLNGKIEFIRLRRSGKSKKRLITFNSKAKNGSESNPILVQGDIIFVRKNLFGKTAEIINEYTTPFVNAYGVYKIFD